MKRAELAQRISQLEKEIELPLGGLLREARDFISSRNSEKFTFNQTANRGGA